MTDYHHLDDRLAFGVGALFAAGGGLVAALAMRSASPARSATLAA